MLLYIFSTIITFSPSLMGKNSCLCFNLYFLTTGKVEYFLYACQFISNFINYLQEIFVLTINQFGLSFEYLLLVVPLLLLLLLLCFGHWTVNVSGITGNCVIEWDRTHMCAIIQIDIICYRSQVTILSTQQLNYCVTGTVLSGLFMLTHLINNSMQQILWLSPIFKDKDTEAKGV